MVDLVNHYSREQCTTEICHAALETERNAETRKELEYRKLRGNYDVSLLVPGAYFNPGQNKTNACHFVESLSRGLSEYRRMNEEEEIELATKTAKEILEYKPAGVDVWEIPDWDSDKSEDNDSSDDQEDEENQEPQEKSSQLFDKIDRLKEKLGTWKVPAVKKTESKPIYRNLHSESTKDTGEWDSIPEIDPDEKRKAVMNFKVGATQMPHTTYGLPKHDEELDRAEKYDGFQRSFPWYTSKDEEIYFVVANNHNRYIAKGKELTLSYGSRTNRYLAVWYGFALMDNIYDSYGFRIVIDEKLAKSVELDNGVLLHHVTNEERQQGFIKVNGFVISTKLITFEFKSKIDVLNMELLNFFRGHFFQKWIADHPAYKKSLMNKYKVTIPFDIRYEIHIVEKFISCFSTALNYFKRDEYADVKLLESGTLTNAQRTAVIAERGWKRILNAQLRMGRLLLAILKKLKEDPTRDFKETYMQKYPGIDVESDPEGISRIALRLEVKEYLKILSLADFVPAAKIK